MKIKNSLMTIVLCILCISDSNAQEVKSDLDKISKAMQAESYSAGIEYKSFLDGVLSETTQSKVVVNKSSYNISIGNVSKINSGKYNLTIDKQNKLLVLSKFENMASYVNGMPPLDSFLKRALSINHTKSEGNGKYIFSLKGCKEKRVEIEYNLSTFQIIRIFYVLEAKLIGEDMKGHEQSFELIYKSFTKNIEMDSAMFNINRYLIKKGNAFKPTGNYATYRFLDLLNKKEKQAN